MPGYDIKPASEIVDVHDTWRALYHSADNDDYDFDHDFSDCEEETMTAFDTNSENRTALVEQRTSGGSVPLWGSQEILLVKRTSTCFLAELDQEVMEIRLPCLGLMPPYPRRSHLGV